MKKKKKRNDLRNKITCKIQPQKAISKAVLQIYEENKGKWKMYDSAKPGEF